MAYTAARHADRQSTTVYAGAPGAVSVLGCFVVDLVKGREDVVGELNFSYRAHALCSCSNSKANQPLLAEGRVEHSVGAKVGSKVHGAAEDSAKLNVLPKHKHTLV
jgi:hypothetical protein